jgi:hypothetical protein
MKAFLAFVVLVGACAAPASVTDYKLAPRHKSMTFIAVEYNPQRGYLIDPVTRSCTLIYELYANVASAVAIPVDCAVLAANNAYAADRITWIAPPAAPAEPAPAPVQP